MNETVIFTLFMTISISSIVTIFIAMLYNKFNKVGKRFNWGSAIFAPWYYAQHGRWGLGLLFAFLYGSLIPFFIMIVYIYAGIRINEDLETYKPIHTKYSIIISLWIIFVIYSQISHR